MADVLDDELAHGLKLAKTKRCRFALILKGGSDGALLVSKNKVPPALITLAKKKSGGSGVVRGAVFYEDGAYVFETGKPPGATMAKALKMIAKRDAGLSIKVDCRQSTDPELVAEGNEDALTNPEGVGTDGTTGTDTTTSTDTKSEEQADKLKAEYNARVKSLTVRLKQAILSGTPAGKEAKAQFAQAQTLAGESKYAEALKQLDSVESEITKALSGSSSTPQPKTSGKPTDNIKTAANLQADYAARVKALTDGLKQAILSGTPAGKEAKLRFSESQALSNKKDYAKAMPLLDVVEDQINQALGGGGGSVTEAALREFQARWKPIRAEWQEASETVDGQLEKLRQALLGRNDPELKEIAEFGLAGITDGFKTPLMAALAELDSANATNLKAKAGKLRGAASAFQSHLSGAAKERVEACDRNPYGVDMTIRDVLIPALMEIQTTLATA